MAKILILDDQRCIRELVSEELRLEGYETSSVGNSEQLQDQLLQFQPDLVLLDLFLDGADGFSELQYIKQRYPRLPVVILTAYDTFIDDPRLSQADGYVVKSTDFSTLKQKIVEMVASRHVFERRCENVLCVETQNTLGV